MRDEHRRTRRYGWVWELLARRRTQAHARGAFLVAADGSSFTTPRGERVSLANRAPLTRLLARLAAARVTSPGVELGAAELVRAAWPEDVRLARRVLANRLHVGIAALRKMGLAAALRSTRTGYFLDPSVEIAGAPAQPEDAAFAA